MARKRRCRQNGPREKAVLIRVDDDEKRMLQDAARRRGQTVSLTVIEAVKLLEGSLYVEEEEHDSPTVQALREIEYQLRRIGRNVNQIAHNVNREPNWRYFEGDARRQLEADRADHTAAIRGKLMGAKADVRNREEWWRSHGTEEFEAAKQIIDVARAASREARDANVFKRGRLLRNAEQVAGEQSEKLRGAVPWLEDTDIPSDWDQANRFRMRATKAIHDHDMQPRTDLVDELERRLEQAERAEGEKPSPEQVKALALRMAEQRERAAEDPTQDMNRPEPSGDELLDLSEPEDLGESGPFEERSAPRTKADLLREIRQRADRRTGQQEAEQRQIDPWQAQPPQRRGHGR